MSTALVAPVRMPADVSDRLLQRLHAEDARQVPAGRRTTCPLHLDWAARCAPLHPPAA
ncbi:hypothetical protein [Streptomyces sp. NPDC055243]|uniref:hypothetical protein n=1 Tax=Streptomyces sp. NPDC055243 TaxID=3365720 RepID=UPI0037D2C0CB